MATEIVAFLLCSKCGYQFSIPKCLPCSHTFCEGCIINDTSTTNDSVTCSTCSRKHWLPRRGVADFPDNILIMDLMDFYHTQAGPEFICRSCKNEKSQQYCKTCLLLFCSSCADVHDKIPVTSGHTSVTLQEFRQSEYLKSPFDRKMPCPNHFGNEIKFYCKECDIPICQECTESDHCGSQHSQDSIKKFVSEKKADLQKAYVKGRELNLQLQSMESIVDTEKKINDSLSKTMNETVGEYARVNVNQLERIVGDINKEKSVLLKQVVDSHNKKRNKIDKMISSIKTGQNKIEKFIEGAHSLKKLENDIGFLCLVKNELSEANTILKQDFHSEKVGMLEFVENRERFRFPETTTLGYIAASEPISKQVSNPGNIISPTLSILHKYGVKGTTDREFDGPAGITTTSRDDIIVADSNNKRLQVLNRNALRLVEVYIVDEKEPNVTVGDGDYRIIKYDKNLNFQHRMIIPRLGNCNSTSVSVLSDTRLVILQSDRGMLTVMNSVDNASKTKRTCDDSAYTINASVCVDPYDNIIIAGWGRIQMFTPELKLTFSINERDRCSDILGISVFRCNPYRVAIADGNNHCIKVYGLMESKENANAVN
uniref:Tripartite motif-containing protein 2-like n=1 Tax=Saccoglossus kowalevskii TaxID=10224 RepID=A0ABM0MT12_SACKO|nr:PREDICTED: tripartite motif-containing protein 2-like [Saccoglossus kowalevskii]